MIIEAAVSLSYGFHELSKAAARGFLKRRAARGRGTREARRWRPLSEYLSKPGYLPLISVIGPRWNCHARITTLGPLEVARSIVCRVAGLGETAESWSIVVYDEDTRTVSWAGSANTQADEPRFELGPGRYTLNMRTYSDHEETVLPDVIVDGESLGCGTTILGEASLYNRHLESIRNKSGLGYRLLRYYVFYHLKHSSRPGEWIREQFLPIGNPDTDWHYGHLDQGERLRLTYDASQAEHINTYVSFYNWSSFPVYWCKVQGPEWLSPTFDQSVAYAVRRVKKAISASEHETVAFDVKVLART